MEMIIATTLGIDIHDLFTVVITSEMVKEKNHPQTI
jgi:hypothetical protein